METSPASIPPAAVGLGEGLRHIIENIVASETSIPQKRHRPPSSRTHRSVDGELFSFHTPATLKLAGWKWEKTFLIMQAEARAVRLALSAFSAILPSTMDVWVDNTSLQRAANKGSSESHSMTWELQRIYEFLDSRGIHASFAYVLFAGNPADGISRGRVFAPEDLTKGFNLRRAAAGSCGWRTPKSATS
ncbi:putative target of rapamycin (TOR) kinase 1 [Trypanosoma cruzi]|uniref:Putative target of rapamycin (TOR) kinase 1 n=1 Tax=Trypanosoma cruzi TaxID=5693 RepID=A0A2V2V803_TRYCR|nr:putative target of rapamycin (TOR) kinase 1 [Trypanosoma cruzi]RNC38204.1 protein kinase [Trypanosoma cruzi]